MTDAERYQRLKAMLACCDFSYFQEKDRDPGVALIFRLPENSAVSADLDATIDSLHVKGVG